MDFLNGDPDQPVVMGRTYHEDNRSPGSLPGTKTQMTIRSKTYKGSGFNELRFEDATGGEQVYICLLYTSDTRNGNILAKVAAPESLAVLFNPARNEAYVTHRQAGKVSVIDAKSYKVVKTFDTPTHPNSLALSADGKTLYVSVKQKSTKQQEATQPDDVIRIAL